MIIPYIGQIFSTIADNKGGAGGFLEGPPPKAPGFPPPPTPGWPFLPPPPGGPPRKGHLPTPGTPPTLVLVVPAGLFFTLFPTLGGGLWRKAVAPQHSLQRPLSLRRGLPPRRNTNTILWGHKKKKTTTPSLEGPRFFFTLSGASLIPPPGHSNKVQLVPTMGQKKKNSFSGGTPGAGGRDRPPWDFGEIWIFGHF